MMDTKEEDCAQAFIWYAPSVCLNTRGLSGACMLYMHAMHNARLQKTTLNGVQKKSERFLFFKFLDFLDKLSKINTMWLS